jgi:hypothetical protein
MTTKAIIHPSNMYVVCMWCQLCEQKPLFILFLQDVDAALDVVKLFLGLDT